MPRRNIAVQGGPWLRCPSRCEASHIPEGDSMSVKVSLKVNGKAATLEVEERTLLVTAIREHQIGRAHV